MEDLENSLISGRDQAAISDNRQDWQTEIWNLFKNLNSWKEESNNQFSNIVNSYDKSIKKGIGELAQEVCDLKTQLSETTKVYRENYTTITDERNVLLETVKNLNDEIRQLNAKLLAAQTILAPEAKNEALKVKPSFKVYKNKRSLYRDKTHVNKLMKQENEVNLDQINEESHDFTYEIASIYEAGGETDDTSVGNMNTQSSSHVCKECNFSFSSDLKLKTHIENAHSDIDISEMSQTECNIDPREPGFQNAKLICSECNKAFKNKRTLYAHTKEMHRGASEVYACPKCGSRFRRKSNLRAHMRGNCRASKLQPNDAYGGTKPVLTYPQLIAKALKNAKDYSLRHSEICQFISEKYPYYRMEDKEWQHSIGQHLSRNRMFEVSEVRGQVRKWKINNDFTVTRK